jgi:hypothetical protein
MMSMHSAFPPERPKALINHFSRTAERFAGSFPRRSDWSLGCSAHW